MIQQHNVICRRNNIEECCIIWDIHDIHLNRRAYQLRESHESDGSTNTHRLTYTKFPILERLKILDTKKDQYSNSIPCDCGHQVDNIYHGSSDDRKFIESYPMESWHELEYKHDDVIDSLVQMTLQSGWNATLSNFIEWMLQYLIYQSLSKNKLKWRSKLGDYVKLLPSRITETLEDLNLYRHDYDTSRLTFSWHDPEDEKTIQNLRNKKVNGSTKNYLNSVDGIYGLDDIMSNVSETIYCVELHTGKRNKLQPTVPKNMWLQFLAEVTSDDSTQVCDVLTHRLLESTKIKLSQVQSGLPRYWKWIQLATNKFIRPKQIKIAQHMIESETSLQTQLNMGEGKTTIIMPMLCMHVLKETGTIPRINVLKPLLKINIEYFRCVFGFMGIKLYNDHCDRASNPRRPYRDGSIYITSWESRMSRCILLNMNSTSIDGSTFTEILDESDEIFHPNNSLVYPVGEPKLVDGGAYRWKTWFAIFQALASIIHELQDSYPQDLIVQHCAGNIGITDHGSTNYFPVITINQFGRVFRDKLNELLLDTIFTNKTSLKLFNAKDQELFIKQKDNFEGAEFGEEKRNVMLTLKGAMRYKILHDSLLKRHRVNYGIDRSRRSLVAVPFRGKEYPSYNAEYSQPDAIIALTCQSYYLDGLKQEQVKLVLKDIIAKKLPTVGSTPIKYQSINVEDPTFMEEYYKLYSFDMNFCNYYMGKFVFPTFAKQFPQQYQATTWNLTAQTLTMGFSGTNGMQHLLPPMIEQNDLEDIKMTNYDMDELVISASQTCNHLLTDQFNNPLDCITSSLYNEQCPNLNVLIDAGGDVNDSGQNVGRKWLQARPDMLACLFYLNDEQYIIERNQVSPIKRNQSNFTRFLNKVLVYLDDQHTRGVDLIIPPNTLAMVTIGDGVTRDKLVQACMRMRGLNQGVHHVTFFRSPKVRSVMKGKEMRSILDYCYDCTNNMIKKMLYIHGMNGRKFQTNNIITPSPEFTTLSDMYGMTANNRLLLDIFTKTNDQHIVQCINKHLHMTNRPAMSLKHLFSCNQEQERELEQELEEERQIERPPPYKANTADIKPCIKNVLHNKMECHCRTPCWESCMKYIGMLNTELSAKKKNINISYELLHNLLADTSTETNKVSLQPNIRNQLVWCCSMRLSGIENYLFVTYHEANYLKENNIHVNRLSGFVPQLAKIGSAPIPSLTWNHPFKPNHEIDSMITIFLLLRSRFVPDPTYLIKFLRQFNISSLVEYYKILDDDTDIKNSIDELSIADY
jgi:hypothetical protein